MGFDPSRFNVLEQLEEKSSAKASYFRDKFGASLRDWKRKLTFVFNHSGKEFYSLHSLLKVAVCLMSISLVGCVKPAFTKVPPDESGFIIGSIGKVVEGAFENPYQSSGFSIRPVGEKEGVTITYSDTIGGFGYKDGDIQKESKRFDVFGLALKPGQYEIYDIHFFWSNGMFEKSMHSVKPFSIPFTVERGKTVHLGRFLSNSFSRRGIFGSKQPGLGFFVLETGSMDEDIQKIRLNNLREDERVRQGGRYKVIKYPKIVMTDEIVPLELTTAPSNFIFSEAEVAEFKQVLQTANIQ